MANKIKVWQEFGPKLAKATPMEDEEVMRSLVAATSQTRGSLQSSLAELDMIIEQGLNAGRIVKLPNGMTFRPIGKKDGSIVVKVRLNPEVTKNVNKNFIGKWLNAENIGKNEAELIDLWNAAHPDDPVE